MRTRFLVSAAVAVPLGVVVLLGVPGPAGAQRPQTVDQTPSWPSRYRGSTVVPGQVDSVDQGRGTATVTTPSGEVTTNLGASTVPVTPGDRVDLQLQPTGRSPSVGGTAVEPGTRSRILAPQPSAQPGAGAFQVPGPPTGSAAAAAPE